jgi:hypothetical protein
VYSVALSLIDRARTSINVLLNRAPIKLTAETRHWEPVASALTRLSVLIHPRIKVADHQQVVEAILNAPARSSRMADAARTMWQQMPPIRVQRAEAIVTARGKLLPLHIERRMKHQTVEETDEHKNPVLAGPERCHCGSVFTPSADGCPHTGSPGVGHTSPGDSGNQQRC